MKLKIFTYSSFIILIFAICISCDDSKKKAAEQLKLAQSLYESNDLNQAKLEIDNIRLFYPKQYKTIRQGNQLMRKIELKEQERTLAFCDSIIQAKEGETPDLTKGFVLQKDPEYDELGIWIHQSQTIDKNIDRTYIRSTVDEKGKMVISSVYRGSSPIAHTMLKVENAQKDYAQTLSIEEDGANNYRFKDGDRYNEIVAFKRGKDNGVIDFINLYADQTIKATFIGKKNYSINITKADKDALVATYALSVNLSEIERFKAEKEMAEKKIELLNKQLIKYENSPEEE